MALSNYYKQYSFYFIYDSSGWTWDAYEERVTWDVYDKREHCYRTAAAGRKRR